MGSRGVGRIQTLPPTLCEVKKLFLVDPRLKKSLSKNRFDKYKGKSYSENTVEKKYCQENNTDNPSKRNNNGNIVEE